MNGFVDWLATTSASEAFKNAEWFVPAVQTVHILAISILFSSVFMIDLRIWGWAGLSQGMSETARRYLPWAWGALGFLAVTGILMIIAEPDRELDNFTFWLKMGLIAVAVVVTSAFQATVHRNVAFWETSSARRRSVQIAAIITLIVWIAIIVCGRMIAYTIAS